MKQLLLVLPDSNPFSILIPNGSSTVGVAFLLYWKSGHRMEEGHRCFQQAKPHFISLCFSICELVSAVR